MIPFAPQDLFARSWSAAASASPFGVAPHAPFIGSFHPQIPQSLISSYASSPWLGSPVNPQAASPWTANSINAPGFSPWTANSIHPLSLAALQSGYVSPLSGWQNTGVPFNAYTAAGFPDLSPYAMARQTFLPGFYPSNFYAGAHPGLAAGSPFGAGFQQPAFSA